MDSQATTDIRVRIRWTVIRIRIRNTAIRIRIVIRPIHNHRPNALSEYTCLRMLNLIQRFNGQRFLALLKISASDLKFSVASLVPYYSHVTIIFANYKISKILSQKNQCVIRKRNNALIWRNHA